jgi:hypothetical protein
MRGRPLSSINPQTLVKPWRDQWTPAEEAQHDRDQEFAEEFALADLEPDFDPYPENAA